MSTLRIYRVREGYIQYLHNYDYRVQYNKGEHRPYVGVVLTVGGNEYFVPMESPKPNHAKMKNNIHILKIEGGKYGLLGFNNMIPAKLHYLIDFDIAQEPDPKYRELLKNQLQWCNDHKDTIRERAEKTYKAVTEKKDPFFTRICCDFKMLESVYTKYYFKTPTL